MRFRLAAWHTSLSAALGLFGPACGGQSSSHPDDGEGGEPTRGGAGGAAGSAATGGSSGSAVTGGVAGTTPSGGTSGASGSAGSAGAAVDIRCNDGQPVWGFDGTQTGFVSCEGGFIHRPERIDCASKVPRPVPVIEASGAGIACTTDSDCADLPYGHCVITTITYPAMTSSACVAGCVRDEDCAPGSICLCGDPVGECVSATCSLDSDCGDLLCVSSPVQRPCTAPAPGGFSCQTREDQCRGLDDCSPGLGESCLVISGRRECRSAGVCGRPFLVGGEARLATLCAGAPGWAREQTPGLARLEPQERRALAEHWGRVGLMEHASVAAFARFTLQLLSLGAPSELVLLSQRALGDELRHAETCFGFAAAYAGRPVGPGPLSTEDGLGAVSLEAVAELVIAEACIGETLAAVEVAEAAEHATDPAVRHALAEIAEDERRHSELGWRFLRWAFEHAAAPVRQRLKARLAEAIADLRNEAPLLAAEASLPETKTLLEHGVLTPELRSEARRAAIEELVVPLALALSGEEQRAA